MILFFIIACRISITTIPRYMYVIPAFLFIVYFSVFILTSNKFNYIIKKRINLEDL